jgi:hypothetical protein
MAETTDRPEPPGALAQRFLDAANSALRNFRAMERDMLALIDAVEVDSEAWDCLAAHATGLRADMTVLAETIPRLLPVISPDNTPEIDIAELNRLFNPQFDHILEWTTRRGVQGIVLIAEHRSCFAF